MADTIFRQLIATAADELVSEQYTEPQIAKRLADWRAANPDADVDLQATYQFAQTRDFSTELLGRVLEKLADAGYLQRA